MGFYILDNSVWVLGSETVALWHQQAQGKTQLGISPRKPGKEHKACTFGTSSYHKPGKMQFRK